MRRVVLYVLRVGDVLDGTGHADSNRRRDECPAGPSSAAEGANVLNVVVCDREPGALGVVGVYLDERIHRGVGA